MNFNNLLPLQNRAKTRAGRVAFANTIIFLFTVFWTFILHFILIYITKPKVCGMYDCIFPLFVRTLFSFHNFILVPGFIYFTFIDLNYDNVKWCWRMARFKYLCELWISLLIIAVINDFRIYVTQ